MSLQDKVLGKLDNEADIAFSSHPGHGDLHKTLAEHPLQTGKKGTTEQIPDLKGPIKVMR